MSTIKIQRAYCVELDEIVSIDTARREYFSLLPNRRIRFNFLCSDQLCRFHNENGVRVTGVNYNKLCEEKTTGVDQSKLRTIEQMTGITLIVNGHWVR